MRKKSKLRQITKVLNGFNEGANDIEASISDVITDLQHFCDDKDIDFADVLRRADGNYHVETINWASELPLTQVPRYINREFGDPRVKPLIKKRLKGEAVERID